MLERSVVFAMDYSPSTTGDPRAAMEGAVVDFINSMGPGDYGAIVKFNASNPAAASVVQPFTMTDAAGKNTLVNAAMLPYTGTGSNVYDGINVALAHFISPPAGVTLPTGPRTVVVISDGVDNASINTQGFVMQVFGLVVRRRASPDHKVYAEPWPRHALSKPLMRPG